MHAKSQRKEQLLVCFPALILQLHQLVLIKILPLSKALNLLKETAGRKGL